MKRGIALLLGALLSGCVTHQGTKFESRKVADLRLGSTSPADVADWFGTPVSRVSREIAGEPFTTHEHKWVGVWNAGGVPTERRERSLQLEFKGERLHGYSFSSSMEGDETAFDAEARKDFKIGTTTRRAVEARLGPAPHQTLWPTNLINAEVRPRVPAETRLVWGYQRSLSKVEKSLWVPHFSTLILFFDASDVLIHAEFFKNP